MVGEAPSLDGTVELRAAALDAYRVSELLFNPSLVNLNTYAD